MPISDAEVVVISFVSWRLALCVHLAMEQSTADWRGMALDISSGPVLVAAFPVNKRFAGNAAAVHRYSTRVGG